jgi:hypothetical protein
MVKNIGMNKTTAYFIVLIFFGGPPLAGIVLSNHGSHWGSFIFGMIYFVAPFLIVWLLLEVSGSNENSHYLALIRPIGLLHFGYMYYRQLDVILAPHYTFVDMLFGWFVFIMMSPLISIVEIGTWIADFVTLPSE